MSDPERPAVSIIVPVLNRLELTRACIAALERHTPRAAYELIVVDNGSSDGSGQFLKEAERADRLRLVSLEQNLGFARACNLGARAARGKALLFLNSDTEVEHNWLHPLLAALEADAAVGAVGAKLLYPDRTIQHAGVILIDHRKLGDPLLGMHIFTKLPESHAPANVPRPYKALTAACLLVRREAFEQAGGFDEQYWNGYEDVDLCLTLGAQGWKLLYEPSSVVIHHESQSGPERFCRVRENVSRLHQKWVGKVEVDAVVS